MLMSLYNKIKISFYFHRLLDPPVALKFSSRHLEAGENVFGNISINIHILCQTYSDESAEGTGNI